MEQPYAPDVELPEIGSLPREFIPAKTPKKIERGEPFSRMSAAEHLNEAINALADGYNLNANPIKTIWGRVSDAKRHLQAIEPGSSQYIAAQGLLHKTLLRERHIEHVCVNVANQLMVKQREMLANELEQYYVNRGIFIYIELSGQDKTFIKLVSSLFCEASIDRIADETHFFTHLRNAGFKRVVLVDNNEENVWTYRLGK